MDVSVVVCTRNRAGYLREALEAYERVAGSVPWELVVVNNGSTDATRGVIQEFLEGSRVSGRSVDEPRRGLCFARNAGWNAATGDIVAFTDDDCYPDADYLIMLKACFAEVGVGFLGGRILLFDPDDYPITIQTLEERMEIPSGSFVESGLIHGANLAARRSVLEVIGGFDESIGAGTAFPAGDDVDFVNRASAAGFVGAYDPRPVVYHHHRRRSEEDVAALIRGYNIGRGAFFAKGVLDPSRRSMVSRQWYWRTFLPALKSRENARKCLQEVNGALRYLWTRLRG